MKRYRLDLNRWEEKIKFLFITYYRYTLFQKPTFYRIFWPIGKAVYFVMPPQPTEKELREVWHKFFTA